MTISKNSTFYGCYHQGNGVIILEPNCESNWRNIKYTPAAFPSVINYGSLTFNIVNELLMSPIENHGIFQCLVRYVILKEIQLKISSLTGESALSNLRNGKSGRTEFIRISMLNQNIEIASLYNDGLVTISYGHLSVLSGIHNGKFNYTSDGFLSFIKNNTFGDDSEVQGGPNLILAGFVDFGGRFLGVTGYNHQSHDIVAFSSEISFNMSMLFSTGTVRFNKSPLFLENVYLMVSLFSRLF